MSTVDPVEEFIGLVKREVTEVESADELLAVAKVIVYVLGAPQDTA